MRLWPMLSLAGWFLALGAPLSAGRPEGWTLVWSDEFDGSGAPDPAQWTHETGAGGWGNAEVQNYTASLDNVRVEDGHLVIEVHQSGGSRTPTYTSGRLITREKAQWRYGRVEVRAWLPANTGTWPAIWLLAGDRIHSTKAWPDNGEIDIMEHVGYEEDPLYRALRGDPRLPNLHSTLHTQTRFSSQGVGGSTFLADVTTAFHTYAVNWYPDRMEFEVDDVPHFTVERSDLVPLRRPSGAIWPYWPFDQRFFLILNVAVGGAWGGAFNTRNFPESPYGTDGIDHAAPWPQRLTVDYVRVFADPSPPVPQELPGRLDVAAFEGGSGILLELSNHPASPYHLAYLDAGDTASFPVRARRAGAYRVRATVAAPSASGVVRLVNPRTGSSSGAQAVPPTGGWQVWTTLDLGLLEFAEGSNDLRLEVVAAGFNLAGLQVSGDPAGTWHGLPIDHLGLVETGSWMGWIDTAQAPWIYSFNLRNWYYPAGFDDPVFPTGSQWIYVPRPPSSR